MLRHHANPEMFGFDIRLIMRPIMTTRSRFNHGLAHDALKDVRLKHASLDPCELLEGFHTPPHGDINGQSISFDQRQLVLMMQEIIV